MSDQPLLVATRLSKRFGGLHAVDNLDLEVHEGEILGVIGPNGAGKTTTFSMLAGALPATSGHIRFDGHDVTGQPAHAMAQCGILRTFQHNKPFNSMSVQENVMVGMHRELHGSLWSLLGATPVAGRAEQAATARADELIEFVGLADAAAADVATLSFGQGRLLEIARALAAKPRLIMFDEPAAGLTPSECERLSSVIRQIAGRGIAVLLIEHDMRFMLALAERVAVLNFGVKIAQGTPAEIRADAQVVAAYLGDLGSLENA